MNSQQRDSKKIIRFKHELKMTFLFNFLRLSKEVETLGKNGGASTRPCFKKIFREPFGLPTIPAKVPSPPGWSPEN